MQVETQKLLTGGLNVLPPGDMVREGDAVEMLNWRADQLGALRSRLREAAVGPDTYATPIHTLFLELRNPRRYVGGADQLYRNGASIASGFDGEPLGLVNWAGYTWVMNRAKQGAIDGLGFVDWLPAAPGAAPTLAAAAGPGLTGEYTYYVSYDTDDGHESDLSDGATITLADQKADLSGIPTSADVQVTKRHIYRSGGAQDGLYRVATINDNVTTTLAGEAMSDVEAATLGITHDADHQPPPAARTLGLYRDRLIAANSTEHPNWFWWTPPNKPWYWPGSNLDEGNHAPVGEDGEEIVATSFKPRMVIFYKARSIWRMVGDPDEASGELEQTHSDIGLTGPEAWASAGPVDYLEGQEGIYRFNGDQAVKVSPTLDPLFKGEYVTQEGNAPLAPLNLNPAVRWLNRMAYRNGRLYFSYADSSATSPNTTVILNTETGHWYRDSRGFTALHNEGAKGDLLGALAGDDKVYALEQDGSDSLHLIYQSAYSDQGQPNAIKLYTDIAVDHNTGGASLGVEAYTDLGRAITSLGPISSTAFESDVLPVNVEAKNFSVRIEGDTTGTARLNGLHLRYIVVGQELRLWDSQTAGPLDLGYAGLKTLSAIAAELATAADVTWTLYTDEGGSLALAESGTITHRAGRQRPVIRLSRPYDCRLARLVLSSPLAFRLYGTPEIHAQPIGRELYEYDSQGQDLGHAGIKQVNQIAVDVQTTAAFGWELYTDEGGYLALVESGTISHQAGRQRPIIALSRIHEARLYRLRLTSPGAFRLFGADISARALGLYLPAGTRLTLPPMDFGTRRLKLLQQVALELDGSLTISAETDVPGDALAERAAGTLTAASASWRPLAFPTRTRGRVLSLSLVAVETTRLYAGRVRYKAIGEAANSVWDWAPLAIEATPAVFAWAALPVAAAA